LSEVASLRHASNSPRKTRSLNSDFLAAVHVTGEAFQQSHAPPIFLLVDSLLDTSAFDDVEAVAPASWRRWLRRALWSGVRARRWLLELDFWRCVAMAMALCEGATQGGVARLWHARAQAQKRRLLRRSSSWVPG